MANVGIAIVNHPFLMVGIPPIKMVMNRGWFIIAISTLLHLAKLSLEFGPKKTGPMGPERHGNARLVIHLRLPRISHAYIKLDHPMRPAAGPMPVARLVASGFATPFPCEIPQQRRLPLISISPICFKCQKSRPPRQPHRDPQEDLKAPSKTTIQEIWEASTI